MQVIEREKALRDWLNPVSSNDTGAVLTNISFDVYANEYEDKSKPVTYDISYSTTLTIRDCSRQVALDFGFGFYNLDNSKPKKAKKKWQEFHKSYEERQEKIEVLRKHLDEVEQTMTKAYLDVCDQFGQ